MHTRDRGERRGDARYETFVLRLWVEGSNYRHGDVRHVQSTASLRFENLQRALDFVVNIIDGCETGGRAPSVTRDPGAH